MFKKNYIISIAGTVGVGKSTMTKRLAEKLDYKTSFESVDDNPYLEKYYNDFDRWGFHLQIYFLSCRFKDARKMFEYGGGFVQDRTIYEDIYIFAQMNFDNGSMTSEDFDTYKNLFDAMVLNPFFNAPDLIIYLEGDLDSIVSRIDQRGREIENKTSIDYWENLHGRYEKWINNFSLAPVLRININDYDLHSGDDSGIDDIVSKVKVILNEKENYS